MLTPEQTKRMMVDAIIGGVPIPRGGFNEKLTPYCGHGNNEDWKFDRKVLEGWALENLIEFYWKHRG